MLSIVVGLITSGPVLNFLIPLWCLLIQTLVRFFPLLKPLIPLAENAIESAVTRELEANKVPNSEEIESKLHALFASDDKIE